VAARLGEKRTVLGLGFLAIAFQLLVWLVPNVIGDSIAVALVGFVLGPMAPVSMVYFARLIPKSVQTTALSFVSTGGSSGGAIWPFLTGLIAQATGTYVLHPICLGLFAVMIASWWVLPNVDKRRE
jgi:MFS family permease